jgi:predicted MPP superfamily phosphohydrolase
MENAKPKGKFSRISRRRFLAGAILASPLLVAADAKWLEPNWVKTRTIRLGTGKPTRRLVHITDIHHKGDRNYFLSVVNKINALSPDLVCFTGDLIEEKKYLDEALDIFRQVKSPVYGVPGNHDYWSHVSFDGIAKCLAGTGGRWLQDEQHVTPDGKLNLVGLTCLSSNQPPITVPGATRNILLMHYPAWVEKLGPAKFDLILAGHSHGGQVRIPFYGAVFVPFGVGRYVMGLFQTLAGKLYVNPGIGWFPVPIRFNCRPEITVFEL